MDNKKFVIDASSLIEAFHIYPLGKKSFNNIWNQIGKLFEEGKLISSSEILDEVKDEELKKWLNPYKKFFLPLTEDIQLSARKVLRDYPNIINVLNTKKASSNGDPFIIATAMVNEGIVVTQERAGDNKIPNVCKAFNIPCINLEQFIDEIVE